MKVEMISLSCGPEGTLRPGFTYDLPDAEAADLVEKGYAREAAPDVPALADPASAASVEYSDGETDPVVPPAAPEAPPEAPPETAPAGDPAPATEPPAETPVVPPSDPETAPAGDPAPPADPA